MLPGEPNELARLDDCGNYITTATSDTDMRGSQATINTGLNDCPCDPVNVGQNMPAVLCSRDPVPTLKPLSSANSRASFPISLTSVSYRSPISTSTTSTSNHFPISSTKPSDPLPISSTHTNSGTQLSLKTTPALTPVIARVNTNSSFSFEFIFLAFVALVGWILLVCAVAYIAAAHQRVSFSTPSWLRLWKGGIRKYRVGPFTLNGLNELISNREQNELNTTASAWSVSDGVSNVSSSIGPVGDSSQAEHYAPPPLQLSQKESEATHENDFHSVNKYTRIQKHEDGKQTHKGSYSRLVEDDDPELYL